VETPDAQEQETSSPAMASAAAMSVMPPAAAMPMDQTPAGPAGHSGHPETDR